VGGGEDPYLIDPLLSPEGWAYASAPPVEAGDPGRYHALFGRDSLIFALQVWPERPDVAVATLRAHAAMQGRVEDPETDEEPGKIVHEYRPVAPDYLVRAGWPVRDGELRYYGTADATSWFLVVLATAQRGEPGLAAELEPAWRAAAGWLERSLDAGGGFVRYGPRRFPGGLSQQGWRDCQDPVADGHGGGILRWDGTAPSAPLADADCQAVAVAALRALGELDPPRAAHWARRREELRARVGERFGYRHLALEADGEPVPGVGSQLGWLLWADALPDDVAAIAANRLLLGDVTTPFGLRTLSADHARFAPEAYHRGAIWPFDSWLGWAGLTRWAAATDERRGPGWRGGYETTGAPLADRIEGLRQGVLDAVTTLGRAPELYAVSRDGNLSGIGISNRVQAWTVGAVHALRAGWTGLR
jgi:glycogen debranching enzyme